MMLIQEHMLHCLENVAEVVWHFGGHQMYCAYVWVRVAATQGSKVLAMLKNSLQCWRGGFHDFQVVIFEKMTNASHEAFV